MFSQGPPPDHERRDRFTCSGYTPAILDTAWATLNVISAAIAASNNEGTWDRSSHLLSRELTLASGLLWFAASGASSIYGYKLAADCSAAEDERLRRGGSAAGPLILGGGTPSTPASAPP